METASYMPKEKEALLPHETSASFHDRVSFEAEEEEKKKYISGESLVHLPLDLASAAATGKREEDRGRKQKKKEVGLFDDGMHGWQG